ncbi:MAG TPA: hypothetical protein VJB39_01405, partial [Patescibacteria group bacterium]|nr:hypothetical protein [Patescibacteria group bacterium]
TVPAKVGNGTPVDFIAAAGARPLIFCPYWRLATDTNTITSSFVHDISPYLKIVKGALIIINITKIYISQ